MKFTTRKLISTVVAVVVGCWLLTFFVKAHPQEIAFATAAEELPEIQSKYPGDTALSDRIVKTYDLALVLVQSPYMQRNMYALECIRRWAREKYADKADFLHPAVLPVSDVNHDTVFGAFGYNLLSEIHAYLHQGAAQVVRSRVQAFHDTYGYQSFRNAFFDFFGWEPEAAELLARYQNDRAKVGTDVLLWTTAWIAGITAAAIYILRNRRKAVFDCIRRVTAHTWTLIALAYFVQLWQTEKASSLVSMLFATSSALYLYLPIALVKHPEIGRKFKRIRLTPNWITFASWLTFSFLAIQIMTWIRHSAPGATDPVTMLVGDITGNFLHDPSKSKRILTIITGTAWVLATFWAWKERTKAYEPELDVESRFNELDNVAPLAGIR